MNESVKLSLIDSESGTQSREKSLDYNTVDKYTERMIEGDQFPPVDLYFDGKNYYPADGHQRIAARRKAYDKTHFTEFETIDANVKVGTKRDAMLASVSANTDHGLGLTGADVRHAVEMLLRDEEFARLSDREIGRRVKRSHTYVNTIRNELAPTVKHLQSTLRIGADGREIDTANIGANKQPEFAIGSYIYRAYSEKVYKVTAFDGLHLIFTDPNLPNPEAQTYEARPQDVQPATQEQIDAYINPPFPIETMVLVAGNETLGKVIDVKVTQVLVSRPNPNDHGNNSHWAKLADVSRAETPDANDQGDGFKVDDWVQTANGWVTQIADIAGETIWLRVGNPKDGSIVASKAAELTKVDAPELDAQAGGNQAFTDIMTLYEVTPSDDPNVERARQIALKEIGESMEYAEFQMHGSMHHGGGEYDVAFGGGAEWIDWKTPKARRLKFSRDQVAITLKLEDGEQFYRFNIVHLMRWKLDQAEQESTSGETFHAGDTVRTRIGRTGKVIAVNGASIIVETINGIMPHRAETLTKIDDPKLAPAGDPTTYPILDMNGVQLAIGDTVITRHGKTGIIRKLSGSLVDLEGYPDGEAFVGTVCTKIDPVQPGDDQAVDDELGIDEQLAGQVMSGLKSGAYQLNDPDLQSMLERFEQRFLQGTGDDAEVLLNDIQDCMTYLRGCQETLNLELEARGATGQ